MNKIFEKTCLFDIPVDKENAIKILERKNTLKFSRLADTIFKAMFQNEETKNSHVNFYHYCLK